MKSLNFLLLTFLLIQACGTTEICNTTSTPAIVLFKISNLPSLTDCPNSFPFITGSSGSYSNRFSTHSEKFLNIQFLYHCKDGCLINNEFFREDLTEFTPDIFGSNFIKNNISGQIRLDGEVTAAMGAISMVYNEKCHFPVGSSGCFTCEDLASGFKPSYFNQYMSDATATSMIWLPSPAAGVRSWNLMSLDELDILIIVNSGITVCCESV